MFKRAIISTMGCEHRNKRSSESARVGYGLKQLLLVAALSCILPGFVLSAQARSVEFAVTADWPTWTLSSLQEAAEYLASEVEGDEGLLWSFVDSLQQSPSRWELDKALESPTFEEDALDTVWALTLNQTTPLLHPLSQSMLHLYLSIRAYSPTLEMHRSLRKGVAFQAAAAAPDRSGCREGTSTSWAVVSLGPGLEEEVYCEASRLEAALAALPTDGTQGAGPGSPEAKRALPFDHVYPGALPAHRLAPSVLVTLYSTIGTSEFYGYHNLLAPAAAAGTLTYVLRHYVPALSEERTVRTALQGYGVYLDVKNMEYRNIDDSPAPGSAAATEGTQEEPQEGEEGGGVVGEEDVSGLVFSTLLAREPSLSAQLRQLRLNLLKEEAEGESSVEAASGATNMKVWRMRDLGLQAAQTIAAAKDPLRKLQELAQNFPSRATRLSSLKVKEEYRTGAATALRSRALGYGTVLKPGTLFLNGLPRSLAGPIFNVFDILKALRGEIRALQRLAHLPAPPALRQQLIGMAATAPLLAHASEGQGRRGPPGQETRLDIYRGSKGALVYLNNLEKDAQYKRWPSSLRQLLFPSWQLQTIARNLYTLTLVLDLEDPDSWEALATLRRIYSRQFPVRFSVLLVSQACLARAEGKQGSLEAGGEEEFFLAGVREVVEGEGKHREPATSEVVGMLFHHLREEHGLEAATAFLFGLGVGGSWEVPAGAGAVGGEKVPAELGTYADVVSAYSQAVAVVKKSWKGGAYAEEAWAALAAGKGAEGARLMHKLVAERGIPVGSVVLNGKLQVTLDVEEALMQMLGEEQQLLSQMVGAGTLKDSTKSVLGALLKGPGVMERYHPWMDEDLRREAPAVMWLGGGKGGRARELVERLDYLHPPGTRAEVKALTVVLQGDLGSAEGLASASALLSFLRGGRWRSEEAAAVSKRKKEAPRCALVHTPAPTAADKGALLAHMTRVVSCRSEAGEEREDVLLQVLERLAIFLRAEEGEAAERPSAYDRFLDVLKKESEAGGPAQGPEASALLRTAEELREDATEGFRKASAQEQSRNSGSSPREGLGIQSADGGEEEGSLALVVNGRQVDLGGKALHPLDMEVILKLESQVFTLPLLALCNPRASPDAGAAQASPATARRISDLVAMAHSFLNVYARHPRVDVEGHLRLLQDSPAESLLLDLQPLGSAGGRVGQEDDPVLSNLSVTVLLDPLGEAAQRLAPILTTLRDHFHLPLRVLLAPHPELSEFPLKSYYRFALFPTRETHVLFQSLPPSLVLTTRVDTPEAWNVQTRQALQDLDNLKCEQGETGLVCGDREGSSHTSAELVLKNLLVSGQCFDAKLLEPVNGLQLVLVDGLEGAEGGEETAGRRQHHSDTLVMQNNAYFQLRADPGIWKVRLAEGRARELYEVVREDPTGRALVRVPEQELVVAKRDFTNALETLRVQKQAGKEDIPLLDEINQDEAEGGKEQRESKTWSTLSNLWAGRKAEVEGKPTGEGSGEEDETVHVFSLATGHLYERMLKIMMLSVSKRTSVPVKFWLLENFLSPAFKTAALAMAEHYNFQVEFITYKWPDWLRQQTEKQRIIWGYKILFLDVLFPLSVKKIIYVDADQVLRADLKELWDLDLKGRPYAYTPFCDSRNETLGFQFWRSGYWATHLQGRPYHISALYVVDLARFRLMGVGDKLRAVYDQLSRDPNSLANLDQDLPNYTRKCPQTPRFEVGCACG